MTEGPKPTKEHEWLTRLTGSWSCVMRADMGPGQPEAVHTGDETARMLGDLWWVAECDARAPDGARGKNIMMLGYDPKKGRFVGSFISSNMTMMWSYEGTLEGDVLTLDTVGPSFTDENRSTKYQDIIEIVSESERTMTSRALMDDGSWAVFMKATYKRTTA